MGISRLMKLLAPVWVLERAKVLAEQMQFSANAQTVNDLTGQFNTVSAGVGAGLSGTVDGFTGTTS
jgi:hypothetical protein